MLKKNLSVLVVSLLLSFLTLPAHATLPVTYSPNHYECLGNKVKVVYGQASGVANLYRMTVTIGTKIYTATTPYIATEQTLIGNLEEMVLKVNPDVNTSYGSVIIPTIWRVG